MSRQGQNIADFMRILSPEAKNGRTIEKFVFLASLGRLGDDEHSRQHQSLPSSDGHRLEMSLFLGTGTQAAPDESSSLWERNHDATVGFYDPQSKS
jgi:hypothetical protein